VIPALSADDGVYEVPKLATISTQLGQVEAVASVGSTALLVATASQ
jgi:hypothetical protein